MSVNEKLREAAAALSIEDIVLHTIHAELAPDVYPGINLDPRDAVSVQMKTPTCNDFARIAAPNPDRDRVVFVLHTSIRVLRGSAAELADFPKEEVESLVLATVHASFICCFGMPDDAKLDDHHFAEFGKHNVPFTAWPYWREIVQSACNRMGLPRVVLPPYRLKRSAESLTALKADKKPKSLADALKRPE